MTTDRVTDQPHKEVTMTKRLVLVALVVAAALVLAAPAMAFDGYRADYTVSTGEFGCGGCHTDYQADWQTTMHSSVGTVSVVEEPAGSGMWELSGTANAEPIADGPGCAGCHSGNYDPKKHVPYAEDDPVWHGFYPSANTAGDDAFSEPFIGCSSCHRGLPTSHLTPKANMANADICGQCHSRYSASVVPYENYDGTFSTRQYTLGNFNPLGVSPAWTPESITTYLNIPTPAAPQSMIYYKDPAGSLLPWSARGHEEGAQQYNEWAMEGHANSLTDIKGFGSDSCLKCHSADYRMAPDNAKPTIAEAKYGITCQVCHDPHKPSEQTSFWNEERNPQLTAPRQELCVECHTAEIPAGETAVPGSDVHHPMKEMMNGTGGIDVPQGSVSVHKGACVQCHMVPTDYDRNGVPMTGANHVFAIVEPEVAKEALSTGNINGVKVPMPTSSCATCHAKAGDPYATYLQGTLDNRQTQMKTWDAEVGAELTAAATRLGYASVSAARTAINKKAEAEWNASELAFMSAYTNRSYIESEGSWGIHNWDYARTVILKAQEQAKSVLWAVKDVTITSPLVTAPYGTGALGFGQSTTISGKVVLPTGADSSTLLGGQVRLWFKPTGGTSQPIQQTFLSGTMYDEYMFTVMPARNGKYAVQFLGNDVWSPKVSMQDIGLDVAYRVTLSRPVTTVMLNKYVKFTGAVTPIDFADMTVKLERKKGSGAWKSWITVLVKANGTYSISKKMTRTGTYYFRAVFAADADHLQGTSNRVKVVVKG